jgi:8-oxo-dGTP pyrophosphatase MutT (NUDIX family)
LSGEEIHEAAVREVQEETGILTRFKSIVAFRHTTNTYYINSETQNR